MRWPYCVLFALLPLSAGAALAAEKAVTCAGQALEGAAALYCSSAPAPAPTQLCSYRWTLLQEAGAVTTVQGSFMLPPGAINQQIYQASGFQNALSEPVILCRPMSAVSP